MKDDTTIGHLLDLIQRVRVTRDFISATRFVATDDTQDVKTAVAIQLHLDRLERAYLSRVLTALDNGCVP